jgi:hypothetical protein
MRLGVPLPVGRVGPLASSRLFLLTAYRCGSSLRETARDPLDGGIPLITASKQWS